MLKDIKPCNLGNQMHIVLTENENDLKKHWKSKTLMRIMSMKEVKTMLLKSLVLIMWPFSKRNLLFLLSLVKFSKMISVRIQVMLLRQSCNLRLNSFDIPLCLSAGKEDGWGNCITIIWIRWHGSPGFIFAYPAVFSCCFRTIRMYNSVVSLSVWRRKARTYFRYLSFSSLHYIVCYAA